MGQNQKGIASLQLLLVAIAVIGITGLAAWRVSESRSDKTNQKVSGNTTRLKPGQVRVSGSVETSITGPNDAPVGTEPVAVNLVIAPEQSLLRWRQDSMQKQNSIAPITGDYSRGFLEDSKPNDVRITKTAVGTLDVVLEKDKDLLCLTTKTSLGFGPNQRYTFYNVYDCKKFNPVSAAARANIQSSGGFGGNTISCDPTICSNFNIPSIKDKE